MPVASLDAKELSSYEGSRDFGDDTSKGSSFSNRIINLAELLSIVSIYVLLFGIVLFGISFSSWVYGCRLSEKDHLLSENDHLYRQNFE